MPAKNQNAVANLPESNLFDADVVFQLAQSNVFRDIATAVVRQALSKAFFKTEARPPEAADRVAGMSCAFWDSANSVAYLSFEGAAWMRITPTATEFTDEQFQDKLNALITAGDNIAIGYSDEDNEFIIAARNTQITDEALQDKVAAFLTEGSNITLTYDDNANTLTIASTATGGGGGLTAEQVRDTVAAFIQQGSNITVTHDDNANTLTIAAAGGGVQETGEIGLLHSIGGYTLGSSATPASQNAGYAGGNLYLHVTSRDGSASGPLSRLAQGDYIWIGTAAILEITAAPTSASSVYTLAVTLREGEVPTSGNHTIYYLKENRALIAGGVHGFHLANGAVALANLAAEVLTNWLTAVSVSADFSGDGTPESELSLANKIPIFKSEDRDPVAADLVANTSQIWFNNIRHETYYSEDGEAWESSISQYHFNADEDIGRVPAPRPSADFAFNTNAAPVSGQVSINTGTLTLRISVEDDAGTDIEVFLKNFKTRDRLTIYDASTKVATLMLIATGTPKTAGSNGNPAYYSLMYVVEDGAVPTTGTHEIEWLPWSRRVTIKNPSQLQNGIVTLVKLDNDLQASIAEIGAVPEPATFIGRWTALSSANPSTGTFYIDNANNRIEIHNTARNAPTGDNIDAQAVSGNKLKVGDYIWISASDTAGYSLIYKITSVTVDTNKKTYGVTRLTSSDTGTVSITSGTQYIYWLKEKDWIRVSNVPRATGTAQLTLGTDGRLRWLDALQGQQGEDEADEAVDVEIDSGIYSLLGVWTRTSSSLTQSGQYYTDDTSIVLNPTDNDGTARGTAIGDLEAGDRIQFGNINAFVLSGAPVSTNLGWGMSGSWEETYNGGNFDGEQRLYFIRSNNVVVHGNVVPGKFLKIAADKTIVPTDPEPPETLWSGGLSSAIGAGDLLLQTLNAGKKFSDYRILVFNVAKEQHFYLEEGWGTNTGSSNANNIQVWGKGETMIEFARRSDTTFQIVGANTGTSIAVTRITGIR